jgi:two-component system response regulator AtoC
MKSPSLLVVDDDRHLLESMSGWLSEQGYRVDATSTAAAAKQKITQTAYEVVLSDIRLGDGDGFEILAFCKQKRPASTVILMTGYGGPETGIEALRAGAFDLLTKPLLDQELEMSLQRALSQRKVVEENKNLRAQLDQKFHLTNVVGHDSRMQKIFDVISRVADTRATVLITGESGTGKSLIARAIHRHSSRRDRPYVEVACGALPENLLESELFGHVAGSFTGATGDRMGKFKQADTGTIFLDEIGTASPALQVKLLRVLQEFQFEPVGGTKTLEVDARVILATNEQLEKAVAEGRFRQDLYYRVNVINIELPPLRDRVSDIPTLAKHFLAAACEEMNKKAYAFSNNVLERFQTYGWPGNVRELQNVVERAVLLGNGEVIELEDLPPALRDLRGPVMANFANEEGLKSALQEPERRMILQVLESTGWSRNLTAEKLGINRTTLYKKMKRLGLEDPVKQ